MHDQIAPSQRDITFTSLKRKDQKFDIIKDICDFRKTLCIGMQIRNVFVAIPHVTTGKNGHIVPSVF